MVGAGSGRFLTKKVPWTCHSCARRRRVLALTLNTVPRRPISQRYIQKQEQAAAAWAEQARNIRAGDKQGMLDFLESRGYVGQIAGDRSDLDYLMTEKRIGAYVGIDPTAPSIHLGNLVPLMVLFWMYIHGFHAVSLLGSVTARVGDPAGRNSEREAQDTITRKLNMTRMHMQLKRLWKSVEVYTNEKYGYKWEWAWHRELVNNNTWLDRLDVGELLRLLGRGLRLGTMLGRDTVKTRLENGEGMSFSEFMYPILQSWDWWHMYHTKRVQVQIGGSDQFGNIIAGIDAINYINKHHYDPRHRKDTGETIDRPMGFTVPLLTTASGTKFGKTAGNAIWLDKEMTSSFELYQSLLRTADADVERYLKLFTFIPTPEISTLITEHDADRSKRIAQHRLAHEVLSLVHSPEDAKEAAAQHAGLFRRKTTSSESNISTTPPSESTSPSDPIPASPTSDNAPPEKPADISSVLNKFAPITDFRNNTALNITLPRSLVHSQPMARVLYAAGLVASKSEGHRLCVARGAYVGGRPNRSMDDELSFFPCKNWEAEDTNRYIIDDALLILRVGKWKVKIVRIISDEDFKAQGLSCPGWEEHLAGKQEGEEEEEPEGLSKKIRLVKGPQDVARPPGKAKLKG